MNVRRDDLAWAAGFFEGEGHVFCRRRVRGDWYDIGLVIAQKDREPLDHFRSIFGQGYIYLHKGAPGRPGLFEFHLHAANGVIAVMTAMRPWLSTRRQAQWDAAHGRWRLRPGRRNPLKRVELLEVI